MTAPGLQGPPDGLNWFSSTVYVAATGGNTTPGLHSFALVGAGSYSTQWGGATITIDGTTSVPFFSGTALGRKNSISLQDGYYYSFRVLEWSQQVGASMQLAVMKTSAPPVSVSRSGQTPVTPSFKDPIIVSISTSQPKSIQERVYLRWSTDSFITSHIVNAVGSGSNYSATIPPQVAGTAVQYCIVTSTSDLSAFSTSGIIDPLILTTSGVFKVITSDGSSTPAPTPTALLAAPTTLSATAASSSRVNLAWTDKSSNESGFKIQRSTDGTTFARIATVSANVKTYGDTGLTPSTKYYYRVRAYNSGG